MAAKSYRALFKSGRGGAEGGDGGNDDNATERPSHQPRTGEERAKSENIKRCIDIYIYIYTQDQASDGWSST